MVELRAEGRLCIIHQEDEQKNRRSFARWDFGRRVTLMHFENVGSSSNGKDEITDRGRHRPPGDRKCDPRYPRPARHARFRHRASLWRANRRAQSGGPAECRPISRGLCLSAYAPRACDFDITNCDIKARPRRAPQAPLGVYGTRRRHALQRPEVSRGRACQHRDHVIFVRLRRLMATPGELVAQVTRLAETVQLHDDQIRAIAQVLNKLMEPPPKSTRRIGFCVPGEGSSED